MHSTEADPTKPTYLTISEIARTLGYPTAYITHHVKNWGNDPEHPAPAPDAYSAVKDGYVNPLWLPHRTTEWQAWDTKRKSLTRKRQSDGAKRAWANRR